jgi:Family of unknown function (DUF5317)
MILFLAVVALALVLGYAFGGRLRELEKLHLRWWPLALLGLGLQFIPLPSGRWGTDLIVRIAVLACSYALLILFCAVNLRLPGLPLLLVGLALNAAVITPNGGMPVSRAALIRSGQGDVLAELQDGGAAKHHVMTDADVLTFLSDVIPIGGPIHQVASIGDVFVYAGLVIVVVQAMRGRTPQRHPEVFVRYRGKHRIGSVGVPSWPRPTAALTTPPAATSSGTEP